MTEDKEMLLVARLINEIYRYVEGENTGDKCPQYPPTEEEIAIRKANAGLSLELLRIIFGGTFIVKRIENVNKGKTNDI